VLITAANTMPNGWKKHNKGLKRKKQCGGSASHNSYKRCDKWQANEIKVPFISDPFKTYGGHQFGARFKSLRNCKRRTFVMKELKKESKEAA
jgi:hypothetical protein